MGWEETLQAENIYGINASSLRIRGRFKGSLLCTVQSRRVQSQIRVQSKKKKEFGGRKTGFSILTLELEHISEFTLRLNPLLH